MKGGTIHEVEGFGEVDAEKECHRLNKAFKGMGTDEKMVIRILTGHTAMERKTLCDVYKNHYGRELTEDLKAELGGLFETAALALCEYENHYLAQCLHRAIMGAGTDESVLVEILCGCKREMVGMVVDSYAYLFDKSLEDDIKGEVGGDFQHLLVALIQPGKEALDEEETPVSVETAKQQAQELYEAGEGMNSGTDEDTFISIFCNTSYEQLRKTFEEYKKYSDGTTIEKAIEQEFSGDIRKGLLTVVHCIRDQHGFLAKVLHDSMKGAGTDDDTLIRVLVARSEIDLEDIKEAYKKHYKKTLAQDVKGDTSGDYQKLLLAIIK